MNNQNPAPKPTKQEIFNHFTYLEKALQAGDIKVAKTPTVLYYLADYLGLTEHQLSLAYLLIKTLTALETEPEVK